VQILKSVQHKNVVPLKEHFDLDNALCLVLELQEGGDLIPSLVSSSKNYTEASARILVRQILESLEYLHSKNIIHKSVLPENILFSKKDGDEIKLTGFGLSQISKDDKELGVSGGDPGFLAPELISQQEYGRPVDLWSVGVMTYILLCGYRPFSDSNNLRLNTKIRQGEYSFPEKDWNLVSLEAKGLIKSLITVDPSKRLTAKQALEHAWFKNSSNTALPHVKANLKNYN